MLLCDTLTALAAVNRLNGRRLVQSAHGATSSSIPLGGQLPRTPLPPFFQLRSLVSAVCPSCGERRFIRITIPGASTRNPVPVWRYECKKCAASWTATEEPRERD